MMSLSVNTKNGDEGSFLLQATGLGSRLRLSLYGNLVPRARDPLGRGTKGSGIIHLIIAFDWSLK